MKDKLGKLKNECVKQGVHIRILMSVVFAIAFLLFMPKMFSTLEYLYYANASTDRFLTIQEILPYDMCFGELEQRIYSRRTVHNSSTGYNSVVNHEFLKKIEVENIYVKYGDEYISTPLIEPKPDHINERIFIHNRPLPVGEYKYQMAVTLLLPQGVERPLKPYLTEPFNVHDCVIQ